MQVDEAASYYAYRDPPPLPSGSPSRAPSLAPSSNDEHSAYGSPNRELSSDNVMSPYPRFFSDVLQNIPDLPDKTQEDDQRNADRQVASRSKWQAVLLEAGGIGAAVSEESMKRLQYCLHWLQVRV